MIGAASNATAARCRGSLASSLSKITPILSKTASVQVGSDLFGQTKTLKGVALTALGFDGYGLRDPLPARPARDASYPVSVRQVAGLLRTSFRHRLAVMPLCFAKPSPPSGWPGTFTPKLSNMPGTQREAVRPRD